MMAEAHGMVHWGLGSHHILLGLLTSEGPASEVLIRAGLSLPRAREVAGRVHKELGVDPRRRPALAVATTKKAAQVKTLLAAKDVCIELQQFEAASQLRDLAHGPEHS